MYRVPTSPQDRPSTRDTLRILRATFSIVVPPLVMMTAVLLLTMATIVTFTISPPWALIPLALLLLVVALFVRWARKRPREEPADF
jgi:hypothetical protein